MHDSGDTLYGYHGKIAHINLSQSSVDIEDISQYFCRKYLGGAGFVAYYLLNKVPPNTDPLSPENYLIFANGPFTGLNFPGGARHCVGAISPLTGTFSKAESGGYWGAKLKRAGFDAVTITGKAENPVYLWINDRKIEIRNADRLWGVSTKDTQNMIREELGDENISVSMIGPGGENKVRYACIMHGLINAAGRGGLGAVMGSKNLKAVAVQGDHLPELADPEGVKKIRQWYAKNSHLEARLQRLKEFGTTPAIPRYEEIADLPVNNFSITTFPTVDRISAQTIKDTIRVGMEGCFACPVRCKKVVEVEGFDSAYGGPEMETIAGFGSNCGIDDLQTISLAHEKCNAYSLDTISAGGTIAFAMECFEAGILDQEYTEGLDLSFGNSQAVLLLIDAIAFRKGKLGELLAEGSARAAEILGGNAPELAMHIKKQELPNHSPRANPAGGVGYAVGSEGPDHCNTLLEIAFSGYMAVPDITVKEAASLGYLESVPIFDLGVEKMSLLRYTRLNRYLIDTLVICHFLPYSNNQFAELLSSITGWETSSAELYRIAERVANMAQLINVRRGFSSKDDTLPKRFFLPVPDGNFKGQETIKREEFEQAKKIYYHLMDWDEHAVPNPIKLKDLGIE